MKSQVKRRPELIKNGAYYLMALPAIIIYFIFSYAPMPGIIIAFKKYDLVEGILASPWNGLDNFMFFFKSNDFLRTTFNTLWINFNNTFYEMILSVFLAICINEIRVVFWKRTFQTLIFLPYFFSAAIIAKFVHMLFSDDLGIVNGVFKFIGMHPVAWYSEPQHWVTILAAASVWKYVGYSVIIYLGTISSIDMDQYEAAYIDGANKFQKIRHITIPSLVPTIITLLLLSIGRFFFGNFQLIYSIIGPTHGVLLPTTDVIDTYLYRMMHGEGGYGGGVGDFGMLTAVSLYQSLVGMVLVLGSNYLVKKYDKDMGLF